MRAEEDQWDWWMEEQVKRNTCVLDDLLVDAAVEVVPAVPPKHISSAESVLVDC